jgi:long-chain fatty acid transport protein
VLAGLLQDISLAVYAVQPTVAVNLKGLGLPAISFGAGPTINFGSFSQSKMMLPAGSFDKFGAASALAANPAWKQDADVLSEVSKKYADSPVSATFEGDADVAVGFHLGALYEILPNKLSLGVSYRSKVEMKVAEGKIKGTEDVTRLNKAISGLETALAGTPYAAMLDDPDVAKLKQFPVFDEDNFEATLPLPSNLNFGLSLLPIEKLLLAFDFQWIGWGAYDELVLSFDKSIVGVDMSSGTPTPVKKQVSKKNYHDTFAYRFGAQYTLIDQLDIRCGVYFDESPVDDEYLTPESPSTSKIAGTIGLSFRPIPNLSIDAALLRSVSIDGRDAKSGPENEEAKKVGKTDGIDGRYEVVAWAPSIGLSFSF